MQHGKLAPIGLPGEGDDAFCKKRKAQDQIYAARRQQIYVAKYREWESWAPSSVLV